MPDDLVDEMRARADSPLFGRGSDADLMAAAADEIVRLRGLVMFHAERAIDVDDVRGVS